MTDIEVDVENTECALESGPTDPEAEGVADNLFTGYALEFGPPDPKAEGVAEMTNLLTGSALQSSTTDPELEAPEGERVTFNFFHDVKLSLEQKENRRKIIDLRCKFYELGTQQNLGRIAGYRYMRDVNDRGFDLPMAFIFNTSSNTHIDMIEEELDKFKQWVLDHLTDLKTKFSGIVRELCVEETIRDSRGRDITAKAVETMEIAYRVLELRKNKTQGQVAQLLGIKSSDPKKSTETVRRYEKNGRELIRRAEEGCFPYNSSREWALPHM